MPEASQSLTDEFEAWNTENAERIAALNDVGIEVMGINEVVTQTLVEYLLGKVGGAELVTTARLEGCKRTRAIIEQAEAQAPTLLAAHAAQVEEMKRAQARAVLTGGIAPPGARRVL